MLGTPPGAPHGFFILQPDPDELPFAEIVILALRCFSRFAANVIRFADLSETL